VVEVCSFGCSTTRPGGCAPTRLPPPCSVPVLDGHIARAFGLGPKAFSNKAAASGRIERIKRVVQALADGLASHREQIAEMRGMVQADIPELS
jgi:hypothetical protein